ncbi:MAG: putative kinase [Candidatus Syntrophoarchaeum sp. GoM_oil]|nr:MAG: putative kinase [Candidatus Syntrophoarchaeum sp. GoM_oil]
MIIAITGTPGTGKTAVSAILGEIYQVMDLNKVIKEMGFYSGVDDKRGSLEVEIEELEMYVRKIISDYEDLIVEGHISHLLEIEYGIMIVLRCRPSKLCDRLKAKGFNEGKIRENVEAEALDVILIEAIEGGFKAVYEVDTTERSVEEVAGCIREIIDKKGIEGAYQPGSVNWGNELQRIVDESFGQRELD